MITNVKIGPVTYKVIERPRLIAGNGDGTSTWVTGHILYRESEIRVEQDMSETLKIAALWHESLHGLIYHAGHDDSAIEPIIRALGYGLVQFIRDNPQLVEMTLKQYEEQAAP